MTANLMENQVKSQKSETYHKAKGMVVPFAFLFSVVVYASIFYYVFSFSPSTLFNDIKFWFVISNTLVLIIAADYGAFSSSKDQKHDMYEEYALHIQAARSTSTATSGAPFVSQYPEIAKKSFPTKTTSKDKYKEKDHVAQTNNDTPEKILEVVHVQPRTDSFQAKIRTEAQEFDAPMKAVADNGASCHQVVEMKKTEPRSIQRSKSDRVKHVKALDKKKGVLRRLKSERQHEEHDGSSAKDNELSSMSNEELNRRVEEFIERLKREIRLQGVRNRQVSEFE